MDRVPVASELPTEYAAVVERLPEAALLYRNGVLVHANPAALVGLRLESLARGGDLAQVDLPALVVEQDRAALVEAMRAAAAGRAVESTRFSFREPGRDVLVASCTFNPLVLRGVPYVQVLARDVTARVAVESALAASEEQFRALFDHSPLGIALIEGQRFRLVNPAMCRILGRDAAELIGASPDEVTHPDDVGRNHSLTASLDGGDPVATVQKRYVRRDGRVVWGELTAARMNGEGGGDARSIVQLRDVTTEREAAQQLQHLALHDPLTGLGNRTLLHDRLAQLLARRAGPRQTAAVLFVDLDGFKRINDAFGHVVGDHVLRTVARRLREVTRPADTVARWGGDEFVVLLPDVGEPEALCVVERLQAALSAPIPHRRDELFVPASVGIAMAESGGTTTGDQLLQDADAAMYRAKSSNGRRYSVFDEALREAADRRQSVELLLRSAVEQDRVVLHYQPIVDLRSRSSVGVEALLRLRADDGTLLYPDAFLDLAEETGLIIEIEHAVLRQACEQAARWIRSGHDLTLSINVCAKQLTHIGDFEQKVWQALAESGLAPDRLLCEVTEHGVLDTGEHTVAGMRRLSDRGVRFSVDDFGTGHASMTYLQTLPVHEIKIDRRFVMRAAQEPRAAAIVRAVAGLATEVGMQCVAEGVEDEQMHKLVCDLGAHLGQGYLYARPAPADEISALLDAPLSAAER